jgi:NAD(P)-dependent dehydrogenase (short-subunit alcohol dehydrogenase family)
MTKNEEEKKSILITGGTSGLGLELVNLFLKKGYHVVATGRQDIPRHISDERFKLYRVDFSNLREVTETTKKICSNHSFGLIINNAGILSPPAYVETADGLEYTFQVNFLSHLLINEIILTSGDDLANIRIVSITSPVYRFIGLNSGTKITRKNYIPLRAYSYSKLLQAIMCQFILPRHTDTDLICFSFDPGTFSSSIYRMQKSWFRKMYLFAAPFMRSPARVAKILVDLLLSENPENAMIYNILMGKRPLPAVDKSKRDALISRCYELIDPFLQELQR